MKKVNQSGPYEDISGRNLGMDKTPTVKSIFQIAIDNKNM